MIENAFIKLEELKQLFSNDPLYIEVTKDNFTEDELFPTFIENLNPNKTYGSIEVSKWLGIKDNNIRYYLSELKGYLQPSKTGRNYKFNYVEIFKCYLITLYFKKEGRDLSDIRELVFGIETNEENHELMILKEKVNRIELKFNQLSETKELRFMGNSEVENELVDKVERMDALINYWDTMQQKIIEADISLNKLQKKYFIIQSEIFERQKRIQQLENELSFGILSLECFKRLSNIESVVREKSQSVFESKRESSFSGADTSLFAVQKKINEEKELLKDFEKGAALIKKEIEMAFDRKLDIQS